MTQDKCNSFCIHKILYFSHHQEQFLLQRHPGYLSHRHASPKHRHVCSSSSGWKLSKALKSQNLKLSQLENNWVNCMVFTRRSLSSGALTSWQLSHAVLSNTILRLSRSPWSFLISPKTAPLQQTTRQWKSRKGRRRASKRRRQGTRTKTLATQRWEKFAPLFGTLWNTRKPPELHRFSASFSNFSQHLPIWFWIFKVFPTEIFLSHRFLLGPLWGWC